jgi:hypothetical protein
LVLRLFATVSIRNAPRNFHKERTMITRRNFILSLATLPLGVAKTVAAHAQAYPSKPIRFVVPFPAGGSTDVGARLIAESLSRAFGQQVYVENKSGANGAIGIEDAAKSAPDGYTILVTIDAVATNPHVFHTNIDPSKDLIPIIQVSRQPIVLAAHPSLGVSSLAELIALAKKQPGMPYATGSGRGSLQHMGPMVRADRRPYAGAGALPRRRASNQRFARWPCQAWIARIDTADIALQGRHVASAGANFEDTLTEHS